MRLEVRRYLVCLPILLVAFALRMWEIDARSLWFDESFEYWASVVPLRDIPATVVSSYQPPLFNVLLHVWLVVGDHAVWLRFLSVGFSLLSVVGLMRLGNDLLGLRGAAVFGLLMAVFPTEIKYAQEVAEYAMLSFALAWSLLALRRAVDAGTWRAWMLWATFGAWAIYGHYGAGLVILALSGLVFVAHVLDKRIDQIKRQVVAGLATFVFCVPLMFFLPKQLAAQANQREVVSLGPSVRAELEYFIEKTGETFLFPLTGWPFSSVPMWVPQLCVYGVLALSLLVVFGRHRRLKRMVLWFWGAYLTYYLLVRTSFYAYGSFGFRYMLILLPLFVALIGVTALWLYASRFRVVRALGVGWLGFTVILALYSLPNRSISAATRGRTGWPETEDMREVVGYWGEHPAGDLPTYVYYGSIPAFRYYARFYGLETASSLPPTWYATCWQGLPADYCRGGDITYGAWIRHLPPGEKVTSIRETMGEIPARFWLVASHTANEDRVIVDALGDAYRVEEAFRRVGATAYLLTQR